MSAAGVLNVGIDLGGHTISCATLPNGTAFTANVNVVTTNNGNYIRQYKSGSTSYVRVYYNDNVLATLYSFNGSSTAHSNPVLLPDDFGVINTVDDSAVSYPYLQRDAHIKVYGFSEDLDKVVLNDGSILHPDILFDGDSNGNITLSKDLSAYSHVRICYRDDDRTYQSVTLYQPVGKSIELSSIRMYTSFAYIKVRLVNITATQITTAASSFGNLQVYPSIRYAAENRIYITRVEAWN